MPNVEQAAAAQEFMHGHVKKLRFFAACLADYASSRHQRAEDVHVLELGCGNAQNVARPLALLGFQVTGIDPHGPSIAAASRDRPPNLTLLVGEYADPRISGEFDAVVLSDVLEHVAEPQDLLRVAKMHLKPDGIVLISVPNGYGPYEIEQYLIRIGVLKVPLVIVRAAVRAAVALKHRARGGNAARPEAPVCNEESGHVQHFTVRSLDRLLADAGLTTTRRGNGAWIGGDLSYFAFYFFRWLVPIALRVADVLPRAFVSSWYLCCSLRTRRAP